METAWVKGRQQFHVCGGGIPLTQPLLARPSYFSLATHVLSSLPRCPDESTSVQ